MVLKLGLTKKINRVILTIITLFVLSFTFSNEKVINNGAGWDGVIYREMARNFSQDIQKNSYNSYYLKRTLPWALVNLTFNTLNIKKEDKTLLIGALILNFIAITLALIAYFLISNHLKLKQYVETIGFSLMFYSFFFLKMPGYYPFLNDIIVFSLMLWVFYFYLKRKYIFMLMLGIFLAFTWYHSWLIVLLLYILPRTKFSISNGTGVEKKSILNIKLIKILVFAGYIIFSAFYVYYIIFLKEGSIEEAGYNRGANVYFIAFSGIVFLAVLFLMLRKINFRIDELLVTTYRNIKFSHIIVGIILFVGIEMIYSSLSSEDSMMTLITLFFRTIKFTLTLPLHNFEAAFVYFGILTSFVVVFWNSYLRKVGSYGISFIFLLIYIMLIGTNTESRALVHIIPFVLFPILSVLNENYRLSFPLTISIVISQLFLSRFWLNINQDGFEKAINHYMPKSEFPSQYYYMNHGPWQSNEIYILFLIIFMVATVSLYFLLKSNKKAEEENV